MTSIIALLFGIFAVVKAGDVSTDLANGGIGVKVLGSTLSIVGIVLASVFLGFTLIEGIVVAANVKSPYRASAYRHLTLYIIVNLPALVFFWISDFGGAVWLAPTVEVEFWFWVTLTISWSAWVWSWASRVSDDIDVDMTDPKQVNGAGMLSGGRAAFWAFVTVGLALTATFALYDIDNLMLPLGISAIVLAVFWLVFLFFSWSLASKRNTAVKPVSSSRRSWLKWNHIFILLVFIFYVVLFILGPGLGAVTDYQGIMIGYLIAWGLMSISTHVYVFIFDINSSTTVIRFNEGNGQAMKATNSRPRPGYEPYNGYGQRPNNGIFNSYTPYNK